MTIFEIIAVVFGNFPEDEKRVGAALIVSHTIIMIKIFSIVFNKKCVKDLNREIVNACEAHEKASLMSEQYRIIKMIIVAYFLSVYGSLLCFVFEGIKKMNEGSHFVVVITFWPTFEDDSHLASAVRIWNTIIVTVMLITMISIDCFAMANLIILKYKFITLRQYFENLRSNFQRNKRTQNEKIATEILHKELIEGIVMHDNLLQLCKEVHSAYGTVMAAQVLQSSGTSVYLLLQVSLSTDITLVEILKVALFIVALFFLLALFLCNAGEITFQASLISDAIFYCGWQESACAELRKTVLFSIMQAQRPVIMKAFKMIEHSYGTFIQVLRVTYSVYALVHAQNKK